MISHGVPSLQLELPHRIVHKDHSASPSADRDFRQRDKLGHIWTEFRPVRLVMPIWFLHPPVPIRKPPGVCCLPQFGLETLVKVFRDDLLRHDLVQTLLKSKGCHPDML
jgi:hypothetical protein